MPACAAITLTSGDLHDIDVAVAKIPVQGDRYPERLEQMTGRGSTAYADFIFFGY
jgi:hypothetical protein